MVILCIFDLMRMSSALRLRYGSSIQPAIALVEDLETDYSTPKARVDGSGDTIWADLIDRGHCHYCQLEATPMDHDMSTDLKQRKCPFAAHSEHYPKAWTYSWTACLVVFAALKGAFETYPGVALICLTLFLEHLLHRLSIYQDHSLEFNFFCFSWYFSFRKLSRCHLFDLPTQ